VVQSPAIFVPLTAILEFEWVMRGFYGVESHVFCKTVEHLIGMPHVTVERWEAVKDALDLHKRGLDFADALHWSCSKSCERLVTFDDRKFVRRALRLKLALAVTLPSG
jgi:predicted nucleic-acid-binding protein